MTNPVGRPRTKLSDLPENWQYLMLEAAQEGAGAIELYCTLGINRSAWKTLLEDSEEFREADEKAKMLSQVWWERQGRRMTQDGVGSAPAWKFNMQNRFGWAEKAESEIRTPDGIQLQVTEITDEALQEGLKRIGLGRDSSQLAGKIADE